jgi:hypothetical protein
MPSLVIRRPNGGLSSFFLCDVFVADSFFKLSSLHGGKICCLQNARAWQPFVAKAPIRDCQD